MTLLTSAKTITVSLTIKGVNANLDDAQIRADIQRLFDIPGRTVKINKVKIWKSKKAKA